MSRPDNSINYIEFPLSDVDATKAFYTAAFGWQFQDWGPDYLSFEGADVDGGFNREQKAAAQGSGVLVVLYAADLDAKVDEVKAAGGRIHKEIYSFPGGRRFHFIDPNGSEVLVFTEASEA